MAKIEIKWTKTFNFNNNFRNLVNSARQKQKERGVQPHYVILLKHTIVSHFFKKNHEILEFLKRSRNWKNTRNSIAYVGVLGEYVDLEMNADHNSQNYPSSYIMN